MREMIGQMLATAALLNISEAVNLGREEGFDDIANEIGAYQWSAILDDRTCDLCESLDGQYFEPGDPALAELKPPIHPNCRCILVAVLKEELTKFPVKFTFLEQDQVSRLLINKI
jgi:SPP1 gp7 family putative phage head morphogenesis protein